MYVDRAALPGDADRVKEVSVAGPFQQRLAPRLTWMLLAPLVALAQPAGPQAPNDAAARAAQVQALLVVDCLLPGQVRVIGGRTYLTPRRPTRTTAADCAARGGEYLAYDRADYRSALEVWLPT